MASARATSARQASDTAWTFGLNWMGATPGRPRTSTTWANASPRVDVGSVGRSAAGARRNHDDGQRLRHAAGHGGVVGLSVQGAGTGSGPSPRPCVTLGAFGSPNFGSKVTPSNLQPGPALNVQRQVLVYHRHNSPFGPGLGDRGDPAPLRASSGTTDYAALVREATAPRRTSVRRRGSPSRRRRAGPATSSSPTIRRPVTA